ncbi:MAG: hypothetical protein ACR2NZ_02145, partial [Rubripirellula sp.]
SLDHSTSPLRKRSYPFLTDFCLLVTQLRHNSESYLFTVSAAPAPASNQLVLQPRLSMQRGLGADATPAFSFLQRAMARL